MHSANVMEQPPAKASKEARDEFVEVLRILAHKLSQPLTCLRGSVEVALMGETRESESRQVLEQSLEESHRMAEALRMLRDVLEMEGLEENIQHISWRRSIEKSVEETASGDGNWCPQLICDVPGEIWVKASSHQLDIATRRLLDRVARETRRKTLVQIELSTRSETACLSICEGGLLPDPDSTEKGIQTRFPPETLKPEEFDLWLIRRAIERQGGWFKVISMSDAGSYYQLCLPLAYSGAARHVQTSPQDLKSPFEEH